MVITEAVPVPRRVQADGIDFEAAQRLCLWPVYSKDGLKAEMFGDYRASVNTRPRRRTPAVIDALTGAVMRSAVYWTTQSKPASERSIG